MLTNYKEHLGWQFNHILTNVMTSWDKIFDICQIIGWAIQRLLAEIGHELVEMISSLLLSSLFSLLIVL